LHKHASIIKEINQYPWNVEPWGMPEYGPFGLIQAITSMDYSLHRLWGNRKRIEENLANRIGVPLSNILGIIYLPDVMVNDKAYQPKTNPQSYGLEIYN